MTDQQAHLFEVLVDVVNEVKNTGFSTDVLDLDYFLGGDLGIDSREMLEIWYDLEQRLGIEVHDYAKRDLYTIEDVIGVLQETVGSAPEMSGA